MLDSSVIGRSMIIELSYNEEIKGWGKGHVQSVSERIESRTYIIHFARKEKKNVSQNLA